MCSSLISTTSRTSADLSCSGPPFPAHLQLTTARPPSQPRPAMQWWKGDNAISMDSHKRTWFAFGCGTSIANLLQVAHQGSVQQLLEPIALIHAVAGALHLPQLAPQPLRGRVREPSCRHLFAVEDVRWPLHVVSREFISIC